MKIYLPLAAAFTLAACGNGGEAAGASGNQAAAAPSATETQVEAGRKAFNECGVCHSIRQGEPSRIGPNLFGVVGRKAGSVEGFAYSKAMQDSGVVWNDETLNAYIENPQKFIPGNRMAYAGKADPNTRAAIIAFLETLKPEEN